MEQRLDEKLEVEFVKHTNVVLSRLDQILKEIKRYQQDLVIQRAQIECVKQYVGLEVLKINKITRSHEFVKRENPSLTGGLCKFSIGRK